MTSLVEARKTAAYYLTQPAVWFLAKASVAPNAVSWAGFLVTVGAGALIVSGHLFAAGWVVLFAGFFDILDGALARSTNRATKFGAILDSTLDRCAEAVVLLGISIFYVLGAHERPVILVALSGLALISSFLVSYVRARAEGQGLECSTGFFTRAERVVVLALGLLLSQLDYALITALSLIVVLSFITVGQRLFYARRQTQN